MHQKDKQSKIDLVCGMDLAEYTDITQTSHKGEPFYFCGKGCEDRFKKDPDKFRGKPLLKLNNVWKIFKLGKNTEVKVLRGLNLHIWKGDFVAIIGSSGSGKSTALNMIEIGRASCRERV